MKGVFITSVMLLSSLAHAAPIFSRDFEDHCVKSLNASTVIQVIDRSEAFEKAQEEYFEDMDNDKLAKKYDLLLNEELKATRSVTAADLKKIIAEEFHLENPNSLNLSNRPTSPGSFLQAPLDYFGKIENEEEQFIDWEISPDSSLRTSARLEFDDKENLVTYYLDVKSLKIPLIKKDNTYYVDEKEASCSFELDMRDMNLSGGNLRGIE